MASRHPFPLNDVLIGVPPGAVSGSPALVTTGIVVELFLDAACTTPLNARNIGDTATITSVTIAGVTIPPFLGPVDDALVVVYGRPAGATGNGFPLYRSDLAVGGGGGGATNLDGLSDVTIAAVADKQVLMYDVATSQFKNVSLAAATAALAGIVELATDTEATTMTDGTRAITPANLAAFRTLIRSEILGPSVPAALDTLDELAAALADDASFASSVTTSLAGKQAASTILAALAGIGPAANKLPYFTGASAMALVDLSAFVRTLLPAADAAAFRTTLGLDTLLPLVINAQTGTTYTLVLADAGKMVTLNNAAGITLTVPTDASVAYPIGTRIVLAQLGAGQVTVVGAGGVTVNGRGGALKIAGQYGEVELTKRAASTWILAGDATT